MAERFRLCRCGTGVYEEKRSRFIGCLFPAADEAEARARLAEVKKQYPDARHHVWAYVLPDGACRWSDDGEPGGTAGAPTAAILKGAGLFGAVCVTTRYFGGTLLGSGGLVRAYSKAAALALEDAGTEPDPERRRAELRVGWADLDKVHRLLREYGCATDADYAADPERAVLAVELEAEALESFCVRFADVTGGRGTFVEAP